MDRPKQAAAKVTDFRRYHLSGDLDQEVKGIVDEQVQHFEMATADELRQQLEAEKEQNRKLQEDVEIMKIRNKLEVEQLKQHQWKTALETLKQAKEQANQEHDKCMEQMKELLVSKPDNPSLEWLKAQMAEMGHNQDSAAPSPEEAEAAIKRREQKESMMQDLRRQREEINRKLAEIENGSGDTESSDSNEDTLKLIKQALSQGTEGRDSQDSLMQQLRTALTGKEENQDRLMLKALVTQQNKTPGEGGTNTLKPNILKGLPTGGGTMAEWLASLNKQEEGESELNQVASYLDDEGQGKPIKVRSGMLEKATTHIQQKQVWPQQNLGEDWADEDMEFKQLRFEHLVAGETRTIELCTDPAEILGRLRLLRRIAYLKLRSYDWNLLRKMYAAILTSIETKEYSWESNFDRFETILYRKTIMESKTHHPEHKTSE